MIAAVYIHCCDHYFAGVSSVLVKCENGDFRISAGDFRNCGNGVLSALAVWVFTPGLPPGRYHWRRPARNVK